MTEALVSAAILVPAAGALLLLFAGRRIGEPRAGWLGTATVAVAFAGAAIAAGGFFAGNGETVIVEWFDWLPGFGVTFALRWDPLSALMTLVVTGVGSLIHLFSIGYMHGDPRFARFFAYLNLFVASMLTLVLANDFAVLFVGWELVGLCSYLLISFWFERESAAAAGKKAFIVNRVGDVGFIVALMLLFSEFGGLDFDRVLEGAHGLAGGTATAIGLLFLVGAAGKSAQLPLYVWLPDAMEGPTPVSALIHAATMVTAGVYLVARAAPVFAASEVAGAAVAIVGAATALFAATIALAQNDIKKVLAYSTISQLGYMFMAVGAAGYVAGIFHLMTHAFFKALLFLGAGAVIHGMHDEQDMRRMGGLARHMPVTFATMGIAWLAISGLPPLAGFWSKDEILGTLFERGGGWSLLFGVGLVTAALTAFYMTRMMWLTFFGTPRWADGVEPHDPGMAMKAPLVLLAGLSVIGGLVNTPFRTALEHFLDPAFELVHLAHPASGTTAVMLAGVSVLAAVVGIGLAAIRYRAYRQEQGGLWQMLGRGYYVDDVYGQVFARAGKLGAAWMAFRFDAEVIDGAVEGAGGLVRRVGGWLRPLQTGLVRTYGLGVVLGGVALLAWFLTRGAL
ncbi:MAG: NADH-quinone oxidoreductase subunit L [Acidimicrobiia bacterium]|nr:MAG: NADH-quinone oxidoreductase subunit L [Acidimicrobiia bacterium]